MTPSLDTVVLVMLAQGHRPTEIGGVLRHVFGLSMPEAVHLATVRAGDTGTP